MLVGSAMPIVAQAKVSDVLVSGSRVRVLLQGLETRSSKHPVFVLQAGAGSPLEAWGDLPDSLSALAPVVAYDRPGLGKSEFDGMDPTPTRVAHHLMAVLRELEVEPPYVMVGHSWGGPLILYFADLFPDEVVGMLYLDASHPERTWETFFMTNDLDVYAAREAEMSEFRTERPEWSEGRKAENRVTNAFWASPVETRSIPDHPSVPTTIVLGTRYEPTGVAFMDRSFMQEFHRVREERFRLWIKDLAGTELLIMPNAGHFVHRYDVGAVTAAARTLMSRILN
jgi:pimeloyl-ACP methyl ester carboxylesterase